MPSNLHCTTHLSSLHPGQMALLLSESALLATNDVDKNEANHIATTDSNKYDKLCSTTHCQLILI